MKKKQWFVAGFSLTITIIMILAILYFLVFGIFTAHFGNRVKDTEIIELFKDNRLLFENAVNELIDVDTIIIKKESNTSYMILLENNEKESVIISNNSSKYFNCIKIMEKLNITYVSKEYNNVEFMVNSMIGLSQSIVLIFDIEKYKYTHIATKILNIYNDWYYIETK